MPTTISLPSERIRALFNSARAAQPTAGRHLHEVDIVKYASGTLEPDNRASAERHIATCASCASDIENLVLRLAPASQPATLPAKWMALSGNEAPVIQVRTRFDELRATQNRVESLLRELGCIERDGDYALPNGLHADTHINVARLCSSEDALLEIAKSFLAMFRDVDFDTILAHGWTMGMIARRMASLLAAQANRTVQLAETEGYNSPTFVSGFATSSRVLVLSDVFITGGLIEDLRLLLERRGSKAIGFGVVAAYRPGSELFGRIRPLCTIRFTVETAGQCSRCGILPLWEFNPVSCCMTHRRSVPRSPSEFLDEYPDSTHFWEVVHDAKACEHHHVERRTHHVAFVDVARVLSHGHASADILRPLSDPLLSSRPSTDLLVVPHRKRARMLADSLLNECRRIANKHLECVFAVHTASGWTLDHHDVSKVAGKNVFIVDSAVGRGATLDNLFLLCRRHHAQTIGMVTLVSRLSEAHEAALNALMGGRFISGYRFPMRPLAVYRTPNMCPVCAKRHELSEDASITRASALQSLVARLRQRGRGRTESLPKRHPTQLPLPDLGERPLLERCSPSVAAAITLNALHASRNNGMAPLSLPEASDQRIPAKNRAAMIGCLPAGISKWSGGELLRDLEACLGDEEVDMVWAAAASVLAVEAGEQWIRLFKERLTSAPHLWNTGTDATWDSIAYSIFQVTKKHYGLRHDLNCYLQEVTKSLGGAAPESVNKLAEITSLAEFTESDELQ